MHIIELCGLVVIGYTLNFLATAQVYKAKLAKKDLELFHLKADLKVTQDVKDYLAAQNHRYFIRIREAEAKATTQTSTSRHAF